MKKDCHTVSYEKNLKKAAQEFPIQVRKGSVSALIYAVRQKARDRSVYQISYHEGGRRKRRTFAELNDAKREAKLIVDGLDSGRGCALELNGADRDLYQFAVGKLAPTGENLATAISDYVEAKKVAPDVSLRVMAEFYVSHHRSELPSRSSKEAVKEFIRIKEEDGRSIRYLADIRSRLGRFAEDNQGRIAGLDTALLERWLRGLRVSGRTRNNYRTLLQTLFRWARAQGYLPKGTPTAADDLQKAKNKHSDIGILTPEQLASLLNAEPENLRVNNQQILGSRKQLVPYFVLGGLCGIRHSEVVRLDWSDVNLREGFVRVGADKAKTAQNRLVPLCPAAKAWLEIYHSSGQICSDRQSKYARQVSQGLGIKWPQNCLRHSYGSYRLAQIHDDARVSLEMGNSRQMLFQNYRSLVTEAEAIAWFSVLPS